MKKVLGVFITICIFVLNFINMAFANQAKISKPPRAIKNKATNRVNLRAGKPIPATQPARPGKVFPKAEMNHQKGVYPKVETNYKYEDMKWETNPNEEVFPKAEMNIEDELFPKIDMNLKTD
jgi:hypothetical protein